MQKERRVGRRNAEEKKVSSLAKANNIFMNGHNLKCLFLEGELVKRGFLYLKSLVWHEFMVPC